MREALTCFDSAMLWSLMESSVAELLMLWISITHSVRWVHLDLVYVASYLFPRSCG